MRNEKRFNLTNCGVNAIYQVGFENNKNALRLLQETSHIKLKNLKLTAFSTSYLPSRIFSPNK